MEAKFLQSQTMNENVADDWESGLPSPDELTPLSQSLISRELACAFSITPSRSPGDPLTAADVQSASKSNAAKLPPSLDVAAQPTVSITDADQAVAEAAASFQRDPILSRGGTAATPEISRLVATTDQNAQSRIQGSQAERISGLQFGNSSTYPPNERVDAVPAAVDQFSLFTTPRDSRRESGGGAGVSFVGLPDSGSDGGAAVVGRFVRFGESEEGDMGRPAENASDEQTARTLKRPRLVWTPQLHKRFVDAVAHLGIKNAVPKTIMQLMNVDGLTRENVASHLQKYRLYLKRMQGLASDDPCATEQLFASSPVLPSFTASAHFLTSHRRDEGLSFPGQLVPVQLSGLVGQANTPSPINHSGRFTGLNSSQSLSKTVPQRSISGDHMETVRDICSQQPNSPPPHVLALFPTGSL